jgi:hypothetical protein
LDNDRSYLWFLSIKGDAIAETHTFQTLQGTIDDHGAVTVQVTLDSVATAIPIRDERMRELLFETVRFPKATISGQLDGQRLANLPVGQISAIAGEGNLTLHGQSQAMTVAATAVKLDAHTLLLINHAPIVLDPAAFDLSAGLMTLRDMAGLSQIVPAVPVGFTLTFVAEPTAETDHPAAPVSK